MLQPGLQIVNAERSAPFKLSGIKGRTLVNLLGRAGNMSDLSKWLPFRVSPTLESGSAKLTIDTGQFDGGIISPVFSVKAGKHYIALADIKNGNAVGGGRFYIENLTANKFKNDVNSSDGFKTAWAAYAPTEDVSNCNLVLVVDGAAGQYAYYDSVRIYEITAAEYIALDRVTRDQIGIKFPYVDSVQPVRNPYAIRYGENLAPTLYEGTGNNSMNIITAYSASVKAEGSTVVSYSSNLIPTMPDTTYTLRAKITRNGVERYDGVYVDVLGFDETGRSVLDTTGTSSIGTSNGLDVFTTPANIKSMQVRIVVPKNAEIGEYDIENIMLNFGPKAKPFKPREDSMLALQTDLFADPLTGENADVVFEKNGQYYKVAKWEKVVLSGAQAWTPSIVSSGFKLVYYLHDKNVKERSSFGVKYDGKFLSEYMGIPATDKVTVDNVSAYVWISNVDSGWGDNYTPTADEIKAYFMGWRMYNDDEGPIGVPYNGTGKKVWNSIPGWGTPTYYTTTLPTTPAVGWTPYQLVYQLAAPRVEPIVSEGLLTFNEGDNQIEVGMGIVVRESAKPFRSPVNTDFYYLHSRGGGVRFAFDIGKLLCVFKNNRPDRNWNIYDSDYSIDYGIQNGELRHELYDPYASYSVTYLMLDKSPSIPFIGTYASSERAMFQELTDAVQQNTTAVSISLEAANKAFQSGVNAKNVMVEAINASSGGASINDSWVTLAEKLLSNKGMEIESFTTTLEYPYSYVPAGSTKVETIYTFDRGLSNIFFIPTKTHKDQAGASHISIITGSSLMLGFKWCLRDKNGVLHTLSSSGPGYWSRGPALYLLSLQFVLAYKRCYFSYASTETSGSVITTTIPDNFDTSGPVSLVIELDPGTIPPADSSWKIYMDGIFIFG